MRARTLRRAAVLLLAACGADPDPVPSRNWSGTYGARVVESTTDCAGSEQPPPLTGVVITLVQSAANEVALTMGPFIQLQGSLEGDRLEARARVREPISLPDSIARRATPADSLDAISYRLDADFAGEGFRGLYLVRSPDIRALARGTGAGRCEYRYVLEAERMAGVPTGGARTGGPPTPPAPAAPR